MKIQSLAVIFIIIIMPIVVVLSEYINNKITIAETEMQYDTKLLNSTYDAIKAYQLNTVNNSFGDVTTSKVEDVEAAAKTFLNSIASNFNYTGYKSDTMKEYIPAVVFTMYDGYYIYSPFSNTLTNVSDEDVDTSYSSKGTILDGLKPYVYYSCRYQRGTGTDDFVITYTLDNYITIQGTINGQYIYDYGYLYSITNWASESGSAIYYDKINKTYIYDGVTFTDTDTEEMKEWLGDKEYSYVKINGKKYYLEEGYYGTSTFVTKTVNGTSLNIDTKAGIFFIDSDGTKNYSQTNYATDEENFIKYYFAIKKNKSAYEYYKNAYEFSKTVLTSTVPDGYTDKAGTVINSGYNLSDLTADKAITVDASGNTTSTTSLNGNSFKIFDTTNEAIQNSNSNFNEHRKAIIRYVVETNLTSAITGFSANIQKKVGETKNNEYTMPKISETDWDIIENDVCAITFLQGLSLGSKTYNGYSVVANTLTKEYVDENDIYILTTDNTYCKANDATIYDGTKVKDKTGYYSGIWKIDFEKKYYVGDSNEPASYYIPHKEYGSYTSIMGSSKLTSILQYDMYRYMHGVTNTDGTPANQKLKSAYYHALGRERWGSYNVNNINYNTYGNNGLTYFLDSY